jgi:hypothetical protein
LNQQTKTTENIQQHGPSLHSLYKSTVAALLLASAIFVTIILPVEFNVDPLGTGKALGLTVLNTAQQNVNNEAAISENSNQNESSKPIRDSEKLKQDTVTVTVPPKRGVEYKFNMQQYSSLVFQWKTDGAPIYFDFHGEPEGDTTGFFESYTISTASEAQGTATLPFNGVHGWYWKNTSDQPIDITLVTKGQYTIIGLLK